MEITELLKTAESNIMDQLRTEIMNQLTMPLEQFVQSQEAALNALIDRQEKHFLLFQQTIIESNEKISNLESNIEIIKKIAEVD